MINPERFDGDPNLPAEAKEIASILDAYIENGYLDVQRHHLEVRPFFGYFKGCRTYMPEQRTRSLELTKGVVQGPWWLKRREHILRTGGVFPMLPESGGEGADMQIHTVDAWGNFLSGKAGYTSYYDAKSKSLRKHTCTGDEAWKLILKHVGNISTFLHVD